MKSSADEIIIDLNELARPVVTPIQPPAQPAAPISGQSIVLPEALADLIEQVPATLQSRVLHFFVELNHLLKYLDLIKEDIERERTLQKAILIFGSIKVRAEALCYKINQLATQVSEEQESLHSALGEVSFALEHELRRVFEEKFLSHKGEEQNQFSRAEISRAYGILHNCCQQSIIVLAQVFEPMLDGKEIFEDYKVKHEQSVILYRELTLLLQKLRKVERDAGILQKTHFINSLKQFQRDTMHFLMHRDWEEFEGHVKEVSKTYDEMGDLAPIFHKLAIYLETLLTQVSLRTVLKETNICAAEMTS
jgi:hypothetical protein